jgi:hypothetical protein
MSIGNLSDESHEGNCPYLPTSGKQYLAGQYELHLETTTGYLYQENAFLAA